MFFNQESNNENGWHNELFTALVYFAYPEMCTPTDAKQSMLEYERLVWKRFKETSDVIVVHPLYWLAHIRLAADDINIQRLLTIRFDTSFSSSLARSKSDGGWFDEDDVNRLDVDTWDVSKNDENTTNTPVKKLEKMWEEMQKNHKIKKSVVDIMNDLMKLSGLVSVKEACLDMLVEVLDTTAGATGADDLFPKNYNFALFGNPGTGKSTVARLIAKLLREIGIRKSDSFLDMSATDALRKGKAQFATELATLTGGDTVNAPPVKDGTLRKGMKVEVLHKDAWYPGTISRVETTSKTEKKNQDPNNTETITITTTTYCVLYNDGTEDTGLDITQSGKVVIRSINKDNALGGVLFLDEAYDLDPAKENDGKAIMSDIMKAAEDSRDTVSIIIAGYKDEMENKLYAHNVGMKDRFRTIVLDDFTEDEMFEIWTSLSETNKWKNEVKLGGVNVARVAAARLARGRGKKGFANARLVRNLFMESVRCAKRRPGHNRTLCVEDVIGLPPTASSNPRLAEALAELKATVGLNKVKESIDNLCETALRNYTREVNGMSPDLIPMSRLFIGSPGTGKTTVAAIYGRILKELRMLSSGEVFFYKGSDFIGSVIGETEKKTREILALAQGGVLIIDEAYVLDDTHYGAKALNTIVESVHNSPGEDIAVVLLGYESDIVNMLNNQNPGLKSRFDPSYAFHFEDFSDRDLLAIFASLCKRDKVNAPFPVMKAAVKHLSKQRAMKNFGNARAVVSLFSFGKNRMNARLQNNSNTVSGTNMNAIQVKC